MPRDLDLTFDISTGALTLDRVVGNYVKRSETLTLSVTIVSNGASATIPSGLVGTLKPVNTYGTTLAQWTTFSQVGATNVYTASTTINAAAVTTLLGTTTEQANCVFDFAGAGVVESDTLALVLKNNVTRDDDTAPTALLNRNDFLVSNGTGLLVNVAAGYAANGAFVAAQASLAITNATNYIEITAAGVASVNTTAFTAGSYPLATVVASAGAITANTDLRAWITPKPAPSTVSDGDYGDITVSNSGATWTIDNDTVTLAKLAHMPTARVVGRTTAGTGTPELLTISGTGSVAMTTSPSFTTPALGTPSAIVLTNATGTAASLTAGNVTTNANLTGHVTSVGNAAVLGSFTMAQLSTAVSDGDPAYVGAANTFTAGQTISSTTSLLLGTAGSAVGNIGFRNATSGTTTLAPAAGALGTQTVTLPLTGTLATLAGTETLTNKRITQRTGTATSSATPTINTDNVDRYDLTAQAEDITSFTSNLSGTPTDGQPLWISVTGTAAWAITWGASFESGAATLPTTTVSTDRLDVLLVWNSVTSKWRCVLTTATPATDATKLPLAGGTMDEDAVVNLFNGSKWQQSTPDMGIDGDAGFSIICSAGYEYKFALGFLFVLSDNSTTVRKVLYAPATPTATDDATLGYTTDTTWEMADGTRYECTDVTEGAAVWAVVPAFDPAAPGPIGGDTPDTAAFTFATVGDTLDVGANSNSGIINVRDSSGNIKASIDGVAGTASFLNGALVITDSPFNQVNASGVQLYIDTVLADNGLWISDGVNPILAGLDSDGTAQFKTGAITLGKDTGTKAYIDHLGHASFSQGQTVVEDGVVSSYQFTAENNVTIGANSQAGTLNVKDSGGTTTASIDGSNGSASFASGTASIGSGGSVNGTGAYFTGDVRINPGRLNFGSYPDTAYIDGADGSASFSSVTTASLNVTAAGSSGVTQIDGNTGTLTMWSDTTGNKFLELDSTDDSVKLYNSAVSGDPPTITLTSGDGSASFANGECTIDADGTLTLAGAFIGGTQALTTAGGAGAVNLTTLTTEVETTGTLDALTLANGTVGQIKVITHTVGAFTSVLTPTTAVGFTSITFLASLGQTCTLEYTTAGWVILAVGGLTLPVVA